MYFHLLTKAVKNQITKKYIYIYVEGESLTDDLCELHDVEQLRSGLGGGGQQTVNLV